MQVSRANSAKVAIITGAARGIGLAAAKRFFAEGWSVAMLDVLEEQQAAEASAMGDDSRVLALRCDVSDVASVDAAFAAVKARFGRLDAMVANAGIAIFGPMLETKVEDWARVMAVNLSGPFHCGQAAARIMSERGAGAIVNIASISGLRASTLRIAYGTSKAGVIHLTKQQAAELGELGIRANCICPGPVDTAMALKVHTPEIRQDYHDHMPLNRYGLEEELAAAIFFLCSDQASYITGQVLAVDGGFDSTGIGLPTLRRDMRQWKG
jgi:NAD(P)-dependent dehydrogenase (short-subunit alcohol dehydrogenase family)